MERLEPLELLERAIAFGFNLRSVHDQVENGGWRAAVALTFPVRDFLTVS